MAKKPTYQELLKKINHLEMKCAQYASVDEQYGKAESIYRTFFEKSGVAIIIIEDDMTISFANTQFENLYAAKKEGIEGKIKWTDFVHKEDWEFMQHYHILRRLDPDAAPDHYEFRMINRLKQMKYIVNTEAVIPGTKKSIASLIDITDRKIAEESLNESEAKYRTLFESAIDTIVLMDNEKIVDCNFATLKLFRGSRNQMIGHSPWEFMPEHQADGNLSKDIARNKIIAALKGETLFSEWRYMRCDGTIFDAELTLTSLKLHEQKYLQAIIRDITERKIAEEAIIESEVKYRTLFELAHDGMTIYRNDKIVDCNLASLKTFRMTRDKVIGKTAWDFMPKYQPDGRLSEDVARELIRSLLKGKTISFEFRYLRGDGTTFDGEVTFNSIILKGERYYHTIIRDITERKQAEEKLRILTEELKRSNADLAQFAYVASHDLQEPLRMVTSFVQLLQQRYKDKLDKDADEFISFAVEGATWMQKLINDLLKYSRVGTHGKNLEKTDCNAVVNHAISNLKKIIAENNAIISTENLPIVMADYTQLVQLFQNLLSNAIKYRGNQQPEIFINATSRDDIWLFSIKDNGIGIDKAYLDKIFIIFQRLHNKSQYPGTGIGLAICKKIVERHGGHIWVESQPDIGSTFYFTIPISKEG